MTIDDVIQEALKIYKPTLREEEALLEIADKIISEVGRESSGYSGILKTSLEGSLAKRTWVRGREEVDVFVHFYPTIPHDEMESKIIDLGFKVLEKLGGKPRLMYADHPYVESRLENVVVNIVACYSVEPPNWISATDRTPYHTRYILEKMDQSLRDDARLMKAFMIGCNVYGAEIKIRGFSGYLAELLILNYNGFKNALEAISNWRPPIIIDIEGYYNSYSEVLSLFPKQSLIVIDPVDKFRNVASAVSEERLYELILASKLFLRSPSLKFFKVGRHLPKRSNLEKKTRNRNFIAVFFRLSKSKPPDILWGEIKKSEQGIKRSLEKNGFRIYRTASWTDEEKNCLIILELEYSMLPRIIIHEGPPVTHPNVLEFIDEWSRREEKVAGPWISGSRLYVLKKKQLIDVKKILKRDIEEGRVALAKGLAEDIKNGRIFTSIERLMKYKQLSVFLGEFLDGKPPYL
ncbi:MAG: CCA tRNA nucleotidyltransferase [Aigarchaeota archaeon]|nr:CCA tRNA nucleotidyltransferase [Aigarchaeota archaeon]MCX8193289.1 CCA tRNA nucleotidyltransferase [Nitrososphaeria archaeon]MDW7986508.1 CCA tRNA nucleotidyltransferase [Nitrososphaerota archaeon]